MIKCVARLDLKKWAKFDCARKNDVQKSFNDNIGLPTWEPSPPNNKFFGNHKISPISSLMDHYSHISTTIDMCE